MENYFRCFNVFFLRIALKGHIINILSTSVITGKSQTSALMYWPRYRSVNTSRPRSEISLQWPRSQLISSIYSFLWSWAGGILRILQSDWFQERAVFSFLLTTVKVTNYAKCRVKLRIERVKFQFVLIIFCNRAVLLFNFLIKKHWILTKAITVMSFVDTLMRQCVK